MKKEEISRLADEWKSLAPNTLEAEITLIDRIISDRELTRNMYFWRSSKNETVRRKTEKHLDRKVREMIGAHELKYTREVNMSDQFVDTKEKLTFDGEKITIADLKKMSAAMEEILTDNKDKNTSSSV
jgi:hypothetical protein